MNTNEADVLEEEEPEVVILTDEARGETDAKDTLRKERAVTQGIPFREFVLPSGAIVGVYPKPQGYFYKIEHASHEYLMSLVEYEVELQPIRFFRFLRRKWPFSLWREGKQRARVIGIQTAMFRLLNLIFDDIYNPERHFELTAQEFSAMTHDQVAEILQAYKEANNVDDILARLIDDWGSKKKLYEKSGMSRNFTVQ